MRAAIAETTPCTAREDRQTLTPFTDVDQAIFGFLTDTMHVDSRSG